MVEQLRLRLLLPSLILILLLGSCGGSEEPTAAPESPTATSSAAATSTEIPEPTNTPAPADTPVPESQPDDGEATAEPAQDEAYPAPVEETATPPGVDDYPAPDVEPTVDEAQPYPPPIPTATEEPESRIPVVPFTLEKPLAADATVVRGTGPANVPVLVVNVSFMGDILAETVIGEDGSFEVEVPALEKNLWVGVALNQLDGTEFTFDDFRHSGFQGDGAAQVPQVGFIYDSVIVGQ